MLVAAPSEKVRAALQGAANSPRTPLLIVPALGKPILL
jgi:hypothetical protein